jgi:hypothetical protein
MPSIDNNYLFTALGSGIVGSGLLVMAFCVAIWRLFSSGFFVADWDQSERAFRFTMLGIVAGIAISTATCYLGAQLYPLLFLFFGWSEALVLVEPAPAEDAQPDFAEAEFGLMKVLA